MASKSFILNSIQKHLKIERDAEFARYLDVTPQTLSNWKKRDTFDMDIVYTKCGFINPHWLLTGEGEMLKNQRIVEYTPDPRDEKPPETFNEPAATPVHKRPFVSPTLHKSVSPAVSPTHEICRICEEKDRLIAEQSARITDLREYIELLKDQLPDQKKSVG
jgi:hypothetical protein